MPEDQVDDFVRMLVGKKVLLVPDDQNPYDHDCVDGYYAGRRCCHVSARKAPVVREVLLQLGKRSIVVGVMGHNLEQGYRTVHCAIEPPEAIPDDCMMRHRQAYQDWTYAGRVDVVPSRYRSLLANTDYLLERLPAADATAAELLPVINAYLSDVPMAYAREDKENCIAVNLLLQNSPLPDVRACNARLVLALDHLNHPERRVEVVRACMAEMRMNPQIQVEADGLDRAALAHRVDNLKAFPEALYQVHQRDFDTFCCNLYYNDIPARQLCQFVCGMVVCELAAERLDSLEVQQRMARDAEDQFWLSRVQRYLDTCHPTPDDTSAILMFQDFALSDASPQVRQQLWDIARHYTEPRLHPTTQNIVYPQQGSTANIGCDQQSSRFETQLLSSPDNHHTQHYIDRNEE